MVRAAERLEEEHIDAANEQPATTKLGALNAGVLADGAIRPVNDEGRQPSARERNRDLQRTQEREQPRSQERELVPAPDEDEERNLESAPGRVQERNREPAPHRDQERELVPAPGRGEDRNSEAAPDRNKERELVPAPDRSEERNPEPAPDRTQEQALTQALSPNWDSTKKQARHWLALGVGSLLLSGLLALFLAFARMPLIDRLIHDPLFFRRGLVVHVDLALLVWVYALVASLFLLLPARSGSVSAVTSRLSAPLASAGVLMLLLAAGARGSEPILANYVPVIHHPLFLWGLAAFAGGVMLALLNRRLLPGQELEQGVMPTPPSARVGLRAAALAVILAMLCFGASWLATPDFLGPTPYFENLFWGGGHVLQVASVSAMMAVWFILLESWAGREVISRKTATVLFASLLIPVFGAPILALQGPASHWYRTGFTRLMQWGIFPVVSVVMVLCLHFVVVELRQKRGLGLRDAQVLGFLTSAGLTVLGFVLGAMIRGSNTMVPAHYHAAIGAVTASLMALSFHVLPFLEVRLSRPRLVAWQPVVFGGGQAVFALGFAIAGWFGMDRKVYGSEQLHRSLPESVGLAVMGIGGVVAAVGGLLFLGLVLFAWLRSPRARSTDSKTARKPRMSISPKVQAQP